MIQLQFLIWVFCLQLSLAIIVEIPDGKIEGYTDTTRNGVKFHAFEGIRYAEPPVGSLRLQPPQPVKPWQGVYNATSYRNKCFQVYYNDGQENEDCLFVNVFTPKDISNSSVNADLAVMVWFHGGAFIAGSGEIGPKFFMDKNVVMVSLNHRLGPFGFASTGDEVIPGNLGLKDQVLVLKWVQKNIAHFGGDPKKVTLFGQSAGASAVSYLLLSPLAKGLFRGAIQDSGSALSPWGYQRFQTNVTFALAKEIDPSFNSTDSRDVLTLLQSVPASAIDQASYNIAIRDSPATFQSPNGFFFAPVIEVPHENAFITEKMYGLYKEGKYKHVPAFIGMNAEESLILLTHGGDLSDLGNTYDTTPEEMVPVDLHVTDLELKKSIGSKIRGYYAGTDGFNNDTGKIVRYHSMQDFDKANIKQSELMSNYSTVYFYQFSYTGIMGNYQMRVPGTANVTHSEELNYLFNRRYSAEIPDNSDMSLFPEADQKVHHRMMALWTNFAKYLNPTPTGIDEELLQNITWHPVVQNKFQFLDINEDLSMANGYPKSESYYFWQSIFDKYAVSPLDTF